MRRPQKFGQSSLWFERFLSFLSFLIQTMRKIAEFLPSEKSWILKLLQKESDKTLKGMEYRSQIAVHKGFWKEKEDATH